MDMTNDACFAASKIVLPRLLNYRPLQHTPATRLINDTCYLKLADYPGAS
jgi:hypothetical protein